MNTLEKKLKINQNTCIHCPTLELAKQVLSIFRQLGLKWCNEEYYTSDHNWDRFKGNTVYYPFEGEFTSLNYAQLIDYKIISAEEFIALHTKKEKFDLENYIPKGDLIGFPKEIIARMLECQVEQGNKIDVSVFERENCNSIMKGGFYWYDTKEGSEFWDEVIIKKDFALFFERYPKQGVHSECKKQEHQESKTAKYVQVDDNDILSDITPTQSSVEINTTEDSSQEFRVGDEVINIITGKIGVVSKINIPINELVVLINANENIYYTLDGKFNNTDKHPRLLHYRDDYDYDVIDFNNLPKRQEPKRWRAKKGEAYYRFTPNFDVGDYYHYNSIVEDRDYASGNYFQTKEEAQEVADKMNKYFQELLNTIKMMKS